MILKFFLIFFIVFFIFLFLNLILSMNNFKKLKSKAFESGFSSLDSINFSFSIHFYQVLLIFVLFDMEGVLILVFFFSLTGHFLMFFLILMFIFLGFCLEWYFKKLIWQV